MLSFRSIDSAETYWEIRESKNTELTSKKTKETGISNIYLIEIELRNILILNQHLPKLF